MWFSCVLMCVHHTLLCPITPARRAPWRMKPLSCLHSQKTEQIQLPLPLSSHGSHSYPVLSLQWVDVLHVPGSLKLDTIPQRPSHNCWIKRNNYFGYCLTESFAHWLMPSYPFKTCIAVPKYPKIFFALRCKLIYDKLNIKIIFSELICITHTQKNYICWKDFIKCQCSYFFPPKILKLPLVQGVPMEPNLWLVILLFYSWKHGHLSYGGRGEKFFQSNLSGMYCRPFLRSGPGSGYSID